MKVFVGLSYDREHQTHVVGVAETRDEAKRILERHRNELLYWAKEATDGPEGGAWVDDHQGDMVGHVLAFDVFGEAKLVWLYDSPDDCLSARSSVEGLGTYHISNLNDDVWEAYIDGHELGIGPLEDCMTMCRMYEDQAILNFVQNNPLFTDPKDAELCRLRGFVKSFLNPEENGRAVSAYLRDEARVALGMKRVESPGF